ncbi:MAG: hypothetical protein WD757_07795 [Actinomycetota bacterium]
MGTHPITVRTVSRFRPWMVIAVALSIVLPIAATQILSGESIAKDRAPVAAAEIDSLDLFTPFPASRHPRSVYPVGGMVFVRCTNLWWAMPDGSEPHRMFSMPGISSPTFSPDARTIAFLRNGNEIWMVGADGSDPTKVGAINAGDRAVRAQARALTWEPYGGGRLAFALVTQGDDPFDGGSAIWRLEIKSGDLTRVGEGWPAPTWSPAGLVSGTLDGADVNLSSPGKGEWGMAKRLSSDTDDLSVALPSHQLWGIGRRTMAVIRRDDGDVELAVEERIGDEFVSTLSGERRIDPFGRPAVANDGSVVGVDLIDSGGQRDLGLLDASTKRWTFIDYAWNPVWSPVVSSTGPPASERALAAAQMWLESLGGENDGRSLVAAGPVDHKVIPIRRKLGFTTERPKPAGDGWLIPATIFGPYRGHYVFRHLGVAVSTQQGRVVAEAGATSPIRPIRTVGQAVRFLDQALTVNVLPVTAVPAGAKLAPRPVDAWSWNGRATGSLRLMFPHDGKANLLTISYGESGFGCGGDPIPVEVAGTPGDMSSRRSVEQWGMRPEVIWPADEGDFTAPYSVSGTLELNELLAVASGMEMARKAS